MNAKESIVFMFKGVSNLAPYGQFHFGEGGGGFQIEHPIGSFILGREGVVSNWAPYWQFHFGEGGGVPLQVDRKSVRFTDSGWLSTAAASGQLC